MQSGIKSSNWKIHWTHGNRNSKLCRRKWTTTRQRLAHFVSTRLARWSHCVFDCARWGRQNANQDLRLASLKKEVEAQGEDYGQLNIAFAAKQQELDMARSPVLPTDALLTSSLCGQTKRKYSDKGTGGINTPVTALRDKAQATRRGSSLFGPAFKPRPSAVSSRMGDETLMPRVSVRPRLTNTLASSTTSVNTTIITVDPAVQFAKSIAPPPKQPSYSRGY